MNRAKLKIAILNLMPTKEVTAKQLTKLLNQNDDEQIEISLFYPESHYRNRQLPVELQHHYQPFSAIKTEQLAGIIVTGAPVERLRFKEVSYWQELCETLDYIKQVKLPLFAICWGAQAALNYYYDIQKEILSEKMVGVFEHKFKENDHQLLRGITQKFQAPHSRYTSVRRANITEVKELEIVVESEEAGLYLVANSTCREIYVFGHPEYELETLAKEYRRDCQLSSEAPFPRHYFPKEDPTQQPIQTWQATSQQLFRNWLQLLKN